MRTSKNALSKKENETT